MQLNKSPPRGFNNIYRLHFQGCFSLTKLRLFSHSCHLFRESWWRCTGPVCLMLRSSLTVYIYKEKKCVFFILFFYFVQAKVLFRIIQNVFWLLGLYGTVYADNSGKNLSKFDCFITLYWLYEAGFHIDISLISLMPVFRVSPPLWMMGPDPAMLGQKDRERSGRVNRLS